MKIVTITTLIFLLSILGGMQAYNPAVTVCIVGGGLVTIVLSFFFWGNGPVVSSLWLFSIAMAVSCLANLDIAPVALSRVFLYAVAVSLMAVTGRLVTETELLYSLILCAGLWLAAELWVRPLDNRNYHAVWAYIFILSLWGAGQRGWLSRAEAGMASLPFIGMLLLFGSRGAIMGLAAGAVTFYLPYLKNRTSRMAFGLSGIILLAGLILWRPITAGVRLLYWQAAFDAFLANPIFGIGPSGILGRDLIPEAGEFRQPHAHNFIISSMAELGLTGLVGLVYTGARLYVQRSTINLQPWQLAIVTGLLCHSLVDEPLFWPGPLFLFGMVAGSIKLKESDHDCYPPNE